MADNAVSNPGAGGTNFRLFEDGTPAWWTGIVPGYVAGGGTGAWTIQNVTVTFGQGLPVQPEGGPVGQSLTNANANGTHGTALELRGGRDKITAQVIIAGTAPPTGAVVALELSLDGGTNYVEVTRADFGSSALNAVAPGAFLSSSNVVGAKARTTLVSIAGGTAPVVNSFIGAGA